MKISKNIYVTVLSTKFTIKEKYNKWHIAFNVKDKRKNRTTGLESTKKNLIVVKNELLPQIAQELQSIQYNNQCNIIVSDKDTVLENFADNHFVLHKEKVRPHVYDRNYSNYTRHILPYFKGRQLDSIKPMELEAWQNRLISKYNPSSVKKYRSIFYGIFTRTLQNEIIGKNPFDNVPAPLMTKTVSLENGNDVINPFTQKEIHRITSVNDGTYVPNFIQLMYYTGMRPGEIIALTWNDINFKKRTITINKTIVNGKVGLPKTQTSIRCIDMLQGAYEALQEQFKITKDFESIFISSEKKMFYSHDIINLNFKKRLKLLDIDVRSLYQLRHSFASMMIKNGVDITWVSKTLGHKSLDITLGVYTKFIEVDEEERLSNLEKVNKILESKS
ncbi:MAG: site-specific integrase [Campylobacterota bacterium]|nr:site-specific integrase [Campylobacterota bacterium]